jgi:hypothetical protein
VFDARWNGLHQDISHLPKGLIVEQIDVDIQTDLALSFRIVNVPTLILLREEMEWWR